MAVSSWRPGVALDPAPTLVSLSGATLKTAGRAGFTVMVASGETLMSG